MTLQELREEINSVDIEYELEDAYTKLYNTMVDYWNEHQEGLGEELFNDFCSYDYAEEYAKQQLEDGGLERLLYAIGSLSPGCSDLFMINAYGNLENADTCDLEDMKTDLLEVIDEAIKEEEV